MKQIKDVFLSPAFGSVFNQIHRCAGFEQRRHGGRRNHVVGCGGGEPGIQRHLPAVSKGVLLRFQRQ